MEMLQCDPTSKQMVHQTKRHCCLLFASMWEMGGKKKNCEIVGVDAHPSVFLMISLKKLG